MYLSRSTLQSAYLADESLPCLEIVSFNEGKQLMAEQVRGRKWSWMPIHFLRVRENTNVTERTPMRQLTPHCRL